MNRDLSALEHEATLRQLAGPLVAALAAGSQGPAAATGSPAPEVLERLTEARYRTLLEQIPAVTFMASLQHGLQELYVSPQIESLLGYSQQEWLQDPVLWYERLHPDDKDRWNIEFAKTVALGERFHSIYRFIAREGRIVWILGDTKIVRDEAGNPLFIQGVGFDITELKDAEEMLRQRTIDLDVANKELEAFAYSVTHDLRTPLRTLEAFSQILVEEYGGNLGDTGRHYLELVRGSASRMAQMIDDFLRLYRISRQTVDRTWVDLSAMARSILRELKDAEPHRVVDIRIEHTRPAHVDPALFRIALGNLLGNAWKFTSKQARATIEFGETWRDGHATYFVRDDGAGFDMAFVDKLFQPFERLHTSEEFSGHGIGLATIRRVVERHGGNVFAEGGVGRGATFYFSVGSSHSS